MFSKIPQNIIIQYNLSQETKVIEKYVKPTSLLCPNRLDIAAKVWYLQMRGKISDYAEMVYIEHIRAMTKSSFIEAYGEKTTPKSFIDSFITLYNNIKNNGFDANVPVPVDKNMQILDGAHRVAICLVLGIKVPIIVLPIEACDKYDACFFECQGVDYKLIEQFVQTYIRLTNNVVCINIWPSAKNHDDELKMIINRYFRPVYKKIIQLNENGALYYLIQIYKEYSWAQNSRDGFSDVYRKLLPCFPDFSPIRIIFVEKNNDIDLIKVKDEMRALFSLDKHSLHITDNASETIDIGNIVLNRNSVEFLNQANVLAFKSTFNKIKFVIDKYKNKKDIIFTGSITLSLYGIREANDIDYLSIDNCDKESHNYLIDKYPLSLEELLYNEEQRFYFFNCPFVKLDIIKKFKEKRNEPKDRDDLFLIEEILSRCKKNGYGIRFVRWKRRIIAKFQGYIIKASHKTGTYEILRGINQRLREHL